MSKIGQSTDNTHIIMKKDQNILSNKINQKKVKPYRLTVQIDKVYLPPCPKSKKISHVKMIFGAPYNASNNNAQSSETKDTTSSLNNLLYNQCLVCKQPFADPKLLFTHIKEHFTCDICKAEFTSIKSHKKHTKIHQSNVKDFPYKCHICSLLCKTKDELKLHSHIIEIKMMEFNKK